MDTLDIDNILNRENAIKILKDTLHNFEKNKNNLTTIKGIYVYGSPGTGKTFLVKKILKELNYDVICYNAGDIRNKNVFDLITDNNMGDTNVLSMFYKKPKKIAIIMDEIDGMNNGDKGGITSLIKLIRPKKTKRQKLENTTSNPIICISNYHIDKKIKELMKVCNTIELKTPTNNQINIILKKLITNCNDNIYNNLIEYLNGDLRKLKTILDIYYKEKDLLNSDIIQKLFTSTNFCDDVKTITQKLLNNKYSINDINDLLNETDKTSIALLFHENIIDVLTKLPKYKSIEIYQNILDNICFGDYMDRITFQKQIWLLTEITFLLKTMQNNLILHNNVDKINHNSEIRFTKILTKYSNEYNSDIFIQKLCETLLLDRKDLYLFFIKLKEKITNENINNIFDNIDKLEVSRIYKFLDYLYNLNE
jgi:hypothetical protein